MEPICVLTSIHIGIDLRKFKSLNFLLECQRIILLRHSLGLIVAFVDHFVEIVLDHCLIIAHVNFAFHLKLTWLGTGIGIAGCRIHVLTHLYNFLQEHERVGLAHLDTFILIIFIRPIGRHERVLRRRQDGVLHRIATIHLINFILALSEVC